MSLSDEQLKKYSRQLVLKEVGVSGQEKLLSAKVLVLGAGGLGSLVLFYLAAGGVGTIGIVDFDVVEISNLQRQIIYGYGDVGKYKVLSAEEKINKLNPDVKVIAYKEKISSKNMEEIFKDYTIVVDGLDNFSDKFLVNDFCVKFGKKLVHAGVLGFEGQVITIIPGISACLRCFFPEKEPQNYRESCKDAGVLGSCVGTLATIQTTEVIKLILDIGNPLTDKILKYNALSGKFYEFRVEGKNKDCPLETPNLSLKKELVRQNFNYISG